MATSCLPLLLSCFHHESQLLWQSVSIHHTLRDEQPSQCPMHRSGSTRQSLYHDFLVAMTWVLGWPQNLHIVGYAASIPLL